jgi:hypothetical protein
MSEVVMLGKFERHLDQWNANSLAMINTVLKLRRCASGFLHGMPWFAKKKNYHSYRAGIAFI